jgi:hypothetical protein
MPSSKEWPYGFLESTHDGLLVFFITGVLKVLLVIASEFYLH